MNKLNRHNGMLFEGIINKTIGIYRREGVALFHKKNLDIHFKNIVKKDNQSILENAWIAKKSTIDYYGVYKGKFIVFEAKSTQSNSLPLSNIKSHQILYLNEAKKYGAIAFLFIYFDLYNRAFILQTNEIERLNTKSISLSFVCKHGIEVKMMFPGIFDFISSLSI